MSQKIQLIHPSGKKAISMDKEKYDSIKLSLLKCLRSNQEVTHTELENSIEADFKKNKIKFEGSLQWHTEWVKLDLEGRKMIKRIGARSPYKFVLIK
jgi:hypothetical protein